MLRLLILLLIIAVATVTGFAQNAPDRPLVTVSGQAEVLVVPDEVVFNLRVTTLEKDLVMAQRRNDEVVKKVLALARSYQVPPELVQTDYISVNEHHSSEEATRKPSVFLGYNVTKKIAIVLRDVSKAERLLSDIFASGVTRIDSVDFRTTQSRKFRDQARALAIKAAQEKASAFARELGQSIGKAYSITEEGPGPSRLVNLSNTIGSVTGSYEDESNTIALGQISVTARVLVSFELR